MADVRPKTSPVSFAMGPHGLEGQALEGAPSSPNLSRDGAPSGREATSKRRRSVFERAITDAPGGRYFVEVTETSDVGRLTIVLVHELPCGRQFRSRLPLRAIDATIAALSAARDEVYRRIGGRR